MMSGGVFANLFNFRKPLSALSSNINFHWPKRFKHLQRTKYFYNMNEAYLKYVNGDDEFQFSFRYNNPDLNVDREFNLLRKMSEPIATFLKRLDSHLDKAIAKKKKKKFRKGDSLPEEVKEDNVANGEIQLLRRNAPIDLDEPCETLMENTSDVTLEIFGVPYKMKLNVPWVETLSLATSILAGFPTYPSEFECRHVDKEKSELTWFVNRSDATYNSSKYQSSWEEVGKGFVYTPDSADINCQLKLRCIPSDGNSFGPAMEAEAKCKISAGPGQCPFETRHLFTKEKLAGKNFRIVSYNLLADVYACTDYSRTVLFPYCPPYALDMDYRKQLIVKEIIGYNSDIICLQEVDKKIFYNNLEPILSLRGYEGSYNRKGDDLSEGVAVFYDKRRFERIHTESRVMRQNISLSGFSEIWEKISNDSVKERFLARNTTVQVMVLRSLENEKEILVIGNTHLYFQPDADHIRLLQAYYALVYCEHIATQIREENGNHSNVNVLLCGDFNSTPDCGVYQLMTTNGVPEDHKDWSSNPEQIVENISLAHKIPLSSACGTPQYTNFTTEFADCLDYIFYQSDNLEVTQVIPFPSKEELSLNQAIPSVVFPSDHIALCADLKWR